MMSLCSKVEETNGQCVIRSEDADAADVFLFKNRVDLFEPSAVSSSATGRLQGCVRKKCKKLIFSVILGLKLREFRRSLGM